MLTKGHDFPDVTLVVVLAADQGLFGADFRASERLAQQIVQVAGRAGRGDRPGEVLIQTAHPEHPLLKCLITEGYEGFAALALEERRAAAWPPYSHLALLRADSPRARRHSAFLHAAQKPSRPRARGARSGPRSRAGRRWPAAPAGIARSFSWNRAARAPLQASWPTGSEEVANCARRARCAGRWT